MKKVLALVLAVVLCMGLGVVAFADYTNTQGTDKIEIIAVMDEPIKADKLKASFDWEEGKEYFKSVEIEDLEQVTGVPGVAAVWETAALSKVDETQANAKITIAGKDKALTATEDSLEKQLDAWLADHADAFEGWTIAKEGTTKLKATSDNKVTDEAAPHADFANNTTPGVTEVAAVEANTVKVTVKFKDYYGVDDIDVDFDLSLKKASTTKAMTSASNGTLAVDGKSVNVKRTFGWGQITPTGTADDRNVQVGDLDSGSVIFDDEDATFATFEFDDASSLSVAGKMSKQGAVNMALDVAVNDEIKALMKKNEDVDFDVLNFVGAPEFDFTQEVTYYIDDEDVTYYVYEIKDGKATKVNAKLNDDKDALVWKTRVLGTYIVTDAEIKAAADAEDDNKTETGDKENPATGASDFVGVAIALGTVSLVAAGAVALKK